MTLSEGMATQWHRFILLRLQLMMPESRERVGLSEQWSSERRIGKVYRGENRSKIGGGEL